LTQIARQPIECAIEINIPLFLFNYFQSELVLYVLNLALVLADNSVQLSSFDQVACAHFSLDLVSLLLDLSIFDCFVVKFQVQLVVFLALLDIAIFECGHLLVAPV
jgi:hypothetical protein